MNSPLILALDIGTSSVRASLYDSAADQVPRASVKLDRAMTVTADGGSEIDADMAFDQVVAAIDTILEKTKKLKGEIGFVAACSFWHSLVGVDAKGKPTTKVYGWADTRSGKYSDVLRKRFDEVAVHNRTGARFHSSFWPAKLLWIRKEFPEVFAATDKWLSFGDYVGLRLFGEVVSSISMVSGTGLVDIRNCCWDSELLKYLKIKPAKLPTICERDSFTFTIDSKYAKRWPRLGNVAWFPAIADGAADNIGAGCLTGSRAALMIGTSGAMRVAYEGEPPATIPAGLWCYRIDRKRVILGGALSDGGALYQWIKANLKLPADAESKIAGRVPGSHGLAFMPFLGGERSTGYHELATGAVLGLTTATDPTDILHAAMEAVAYRFASILEQLLSVTKIRAIVASGGALRESAIWGQIMADVLGRDLAMNDAPESSSRGAVLLALESIGKIDSIEAFPNLCGSSIKADRGRTKFHRKARERHDDVYKILIR